MQIHLVEITLSKTCWVNKTLYNAVDFHLYEVQKKTKLTKGKK